MAAMLCCSQILKKLITGKGSYQGNQFLCLILRYFAIKGDGKQGKEDPVGQDPPANIIEVYSGITLFFRLLLNRQQHYLRGCR